MKITRKVLAVLFAMLFVAALAPVTSLAADQIPAVDFVITAPRNNLPMETDLDYLYNFDHPYFSVNGVNWFDGHGNVVTPFFQEGKYTLQLTLIAKDPDAYDFSYYKGNNSRFAEFTVNGLPMRECEMVDDPDSADQLGIELEFPRLMVTGLTLDKEELPLETGGEGTLIATLFSSGEIENPGVIWTSSDPSVATVDANGKVTGVLEGTAVITAKSVDGGYEDTCTVTTMTEIITIQFNSNGGTMIADLAGVISGGMITEPAAPVKPGYTFGGWYTEAELTNAWDFDADTVTADITLHAKWIENSSGGSSSGSGTGFATVVDPADNNVSASSAGSDNNTPPAGSDNSAQPQENDDSSRPPPDEDILDAPRAENKISAVKWFIATAAIFLLF
ncbi:MAG: InlB B-repeat-containing protein [Methanosarcinales archaeon]|jgi:uncharacterized repeat protein (TIGR02543 family)|nr:InlB B-repeat-containing protein [Methanosarcinales archaeon]